jgi:hypothetical protein
MRNTPNMPDTHKSVKLNFISDFWLFSSYLARLIRCIVYGATNERMIVNVELRWMYDEVVVAYFNMLFQNFPGKAEENREILHL